MSISTTFLPEFDREMATARKVLERIPADKFSWKPHEKSFSMGELASHVAHIVGWGETVLKTPSYDVAPGGKPELEAPAKTQEELLAAFDRNVAATRAALETTPDEAMSEPWTLYANGAAVFTQPRVGVLRGMIFNHLIHHRGQLSVYLRLNDIPVPSLYGPSADEQTMH